jgi:hypothetical protein
MTVLVLGLAASWTMAADKPAVAGARGITLYVSKQGGNSDGRSWRTAFHSIQKALAAVPDARGGHRIIVRPDRYMEANLFPIHKGARGAYNELIGDIDGRLGSGATGWVILDSGDPQKGFKSYDWWGPIRAYQKGWSPEHKDDTFSSVAWDRWVLRHFYITGGDGGPFWDLVAKVEPFTIVVEDCVGIGRAFGGGVANHEARAEEPCVFRRCYLACLDWWGDAGAAYVRCSHTKIPAAADATFEDCTLVSPDNALEVGYPNFPGYTRVKFSQCRLIVLNFSQPGGTPSGGIFHTPLDGKQLQVDLEDCRMMGYKVFSTEGKNPIGYSIKGRVQAYVQFQQSVPAGIERLTCWPVDLFAQVAPPAQIPGRFTNRNR